MEKPNRPIDRLFKAIADPTRREIFHALVLASTALPITQIAQQFDMSRQGVTKHIKSLESAGLVSMQTQGRERFCQAHPVKLRSVYDWLSFYDKFWSDALGRLGEHLEG